MKNPYNPPNEYNCHNTLAEAYMEGKRDMANLMLVYLSEFFEASNEAIVDYLRAQGVLPNENLSSFKDP